MHTYIINNTYLLAAESITVAQNLAETKFINVTSVKLLGGK